jgi:hypothetical protein
MFSYTKEFQVLSAIDKVQIEAESEKITEGERLKLTARVFDTEGNEFKIDDLNFLWEASGGTLDNTNSQIVYFRSGTAGTYEIKVTAKLSKYQSMTDEESVTIQVKPSGSDTGLFGGKTSIVAMLAIIIIIVVCIVLFFLFTKKRGKKSIPEEPISEQWQQSTRYSMGEVSQLTPGQDQSYGGDFSQNYFGSQGTTSHLMQETTDPTVTGFPQDYLQGASPQVSEVVPAPYPQPYPEPLPQVVESQPAGELIPKLSPPTQNKESVNQASEDIEN